MPDLKVIAALPTILQRLHATYPNARYELNYENPEQLLVATILAAQCTDERINQVTPGLFAKYRDPKAFADAPLPELEEDLKPTGFYRQKAKTVQGVCRDLVERFGGKVPASMEDLVTLSGVARKTANVVLNNAFRIPSGVIVDTHVHRVSQRLGLTDQKRPEKIEIDLMNLVPKEEWISFGPAMVLLGRYTCTFHSPRCSECILNDLCPKRDVASEPGPSAAQEVANGTPETEEKSEENSQLMATKKTSKKPAPTKTKAKAATKAAPAKAKPPKAPPIPSLAASLPPDWQAVLKGEFQKPYFKALEKFVAEERAHHQVFPPEADLFNAFRATPYNDVKLLLLGQDPYHDDGQAHGMSFSVRPGVKLPPSLVNIYKELQEDLGCQPPEHGYLASWANQGVLLLNAVLTVRAHEAASHKDQGWEVFTDAVIQALNARPKPAVFLLWGNYAQKKAGLIDGSRHRILPAAHPSPLSSKKFFGSKPFSQANQALKELNLPEVNWQLPAKPDELTPPAPSTTSAQVSNTPVTLTSSTKTNLSAKVDGVPVVSASVPVVESAPALAQLLPSDWRLALSDVVTQPWFRNLDKFLAAERANHSVVPSEELLFAAFRQTPLERVRVVLVGTETAEHEHEATGLAFSMPAEVRVNATLKAFFEELRRDLGCRLPTSGDLSPWTSQGVLLLNRVLSTRTGKPGAHENKGWEKFIDSVLEMLSRRTCSLVFCFLGDFPSRVFELIDSERHGVIQNEIPEEIVGTGLFSQINDALELRGQSRIYWQLPYV